MAHCPYEQLADIADVLTTIRSWPDIREPRPGIFYVKRTPFLHFHINATERWADVRCGADWGEPVPIAIGAGMRVRKQFLTEVSRRYRTLLSR